MPFLFEGEPGEGKKHALFKNITRVGASVESDICINDAGLAEDHAQVIKEDGGHLLSSVGRGRVFFINGKKSKRAKLKDGDAIQIGTKSFQYLINEPKLTTVAQRDLMSAYREIVSFSEDLIKMKELGELLVALMDKVIALSHAEKGFLVLLDGEVPDVQVARNIQKSDVRNAVAELSDSILKKVVREQQAVIIHDALNDNEFKASQSVMNLKLSSVMCVPLLENEEVFGLIYLGSHRLTHLFDQETLELVTVFAGQAALLIRNKLLVETLQSDNAVLRGALAQDDTPRKIVGDSAAILNIFKTVRKVAPTDVSVLITGETGTGKELIARAIHEESDRLNGPFVVLNCGAIPENLLESELFGHVKGAFTGAHQSRDGRFQAAHGGTLFLDEIGEMPAQLQVKLLRALQERVVTKVGDTKVEEVDIRVVSATHRNLEKAIGDGSFREDLYYRLNVIGLHLPPLRERGDDLSLIARYFLKRYASEFGSRVKGFSPQCIMMIKKYPWPGNVRQLENRIKKAVIMSEGTHISPLDMDLSGDQLAPVVPLAQAKDDFQRQYINEVLSRNSGNRTKTAQDLGVDPRTIFRHLEKETGA